MITSGKRIAVVMLYFFLCTNCSQPASGIEKTAPTPQPAAQPHFSIVLRQKAVAALAYCQSQKMNDEFCLLADLGMHSGLKRLFVWSFEKDSVLHSFLVGHGSGNGPWGTDGSKDNPQFSNTPDSHCSSLGKYKLGERGYSNWGVHIKYLMHGLDSTNSNALKRVIVFHSWEVVPDEEVYPKGTPEGWGCPIVSNNSFTIIDTMVRSSGKPVLLWLFDGRTP